MFCPSCGKQVSDGDAFCRFCSHSLSKDNPDVQRPGVAAQTPEKRSGEATASLVLGLFSLVPVVGLLAVIFGHLAAQM